MTKLLLVFLVRLLLLVLVLTTASSKALQEAVNLDPDPLAPPLVCQVESSNYDALACWLSQLVLQLPSQTFREGILKLSIEELQCSNFSLAGLHATTNASSAIDSTLRDLSQLQLYLGVQRIAATCTAVYAVTGLSGHLVATVDETHNDPSSDTYPAALEWWVALNSSTHNRLQQRMPVALQTLSCTTT